MATSGSSAVTAEGPRATTAEAPPAGEAPTILPFRGVRLTPGARAALAALGRELRAEGAGGRLAAPLAVGDPVPRGDLAAALAPGGTEALVDAGLAACSTTSVALAVTTPLLGGIPTAIPRIGWGDDVVYVGEDSAHLIEAALRLAPRGERAVELGTGTGLLAALLTSRYRAVVATDVAPSVALAAEITLALSPPPPPHAAMVCVADVAAGLRPASFDLVAANAPWVPYAEGQPGSELPEVFAHGGATGVELPARFLREGSALLRPGGVAVTLALDVTLVDGRRPLRDTCAALAEDGFVVRMLPTPFNRERARLADVMRWRQPLVDDAVHVAVVVACPAGPGDDRRSLLVAADALGRRWSRR